MEFAVRYKKPQKNSAITAVISSSPRISRESRFVFLPFSLVNIIPPSPRRLDIFRVPGIIPQLLADIFDMHHNRTVANGILSPDALIDIFQGINLLFMRHKKLQNLKLRIGQRNHFPPVWKQSGSPYPESNPQREFSLSPQVLLHRCFAAESPSRASAAPYWKTAFTI